jgi:hypothetical protein
MHNNQDMEISRQEIVRMAQALLKGQIGVIEASRAISSHSHLVDPDMRDHELLHFIGIDSESECLTIGAEEWHSSAREEKIREVNEFEEFYLEGALHDAALLVKRYADTA